MAIACLPQGGLEPGEQSINRLGPGQALAKRPDRLRVRDLVLQARPQETHERQPVANQELRTVVPEIVLHLNDQGLEHEHRVIGRASALPAIRVRQCRVQISTENLEVHRRNPGFELSAQIAQTLKPFINVEKSSLLNHP